MGDRAFGLLCRTLLGQDQTWVPADVAKHMPLTQLRVAACNLTAQSSSYIVALLSVRYGCVLCVVVVVVVDVVVVVVVVEVVVVFVVVVVVVVVMMFLLL
jgi:hypothetical protein